MLSRAAAFSIFPVFLILPTLPLLADEQAMRGKHIYEQGRSLSGIPIQASLGQEGLQVSATAFPCLNCHGHDGRGRPEGGVAPSDITWPALTKPYGVTHTSGRQHPPYTERLLKRAITMGIDSAGNPLHTVMPRYRLSRSDLADLLVYLKQLGIRLDPGLTETSIRVGVMLPPRGHLSAMHDAVRAVFTAYFDQLNQAGGIYNRQLELRFGVFPNNPATGLHTTRDFLETQQPFALAGTFIAGADTAIAKLVQDKAIPLVGAFTLAPQTEFPLNRYIFYLYTGLPRQAQALAVFATQQSRHKNPPIALVASDEAVSNKMAAAILAECQQAGWTDIHTVNLSSAEASRVSDVVQQLRDAAIHAVFFLGPDEHKESFLQAVATRKWQPLLLFPSSLVGPELFEAPASLDGHLFSAFPTLPRDRSKQGMVEYHQLAAAYTLPQDHLSTQLTALASAKVLVAGLRQAGRHISRERLIETLEGLYRFQTGLTPPLTYGPNRRIGAQGAHVIKLDLADKKLVPVRNWITLD